MNMEIVYFAIAGLFFVLFFYNFMMKRKLKQEIWSLQIDLKKAKAYEEEATAWKKSVELYLENFGLKELKEELEKRKRIVGHLECYIFKNSPTGENLLASRAHKNLVLALEERIDALEKRPSGQRHYPGHVEE